MRHTLIYFFYLFFLVNLEGVLWRHDIPEKCYREFSKKERFLPVGTVNCKGINSTGTLISPNKVIVSAHAVVDNAIASFKIYNPTKKVYEELTARAKRHERYFCLTDENNHIQSILNDIAIITLDNPIEVIAPAKIWFDRLETGTPCSCCGYGKPGTGLTGPQKSDIRKRAFTNILTENITDTAGNDFYSICFNSPDEPKDVTSLEGIGSNGDSGAPIFVKIKDEFFMIGILNLLIRKGFYHSLNTILPLTEYEEWFESQIVT